MAIIAIDTRERRQAAAYYNRRWAVAPTPNAAKDQEWRQEVMRSYPGVLAASPTPADEGRSRALISTSTRILLIFLGGRL